MAFIQELAMSGKDIGLIALGGTIIVAGTAKDISEVINERKKYPDYSEAQKEKIRKEIGQIRSALLKYRFSVDRDHVDKALLLSLTGSWSRLAAVKDPKSDSQEFVIPRQRFPKKGVFHEFTIVNEDDVLTLSHAEYEGEKDDEVSYFEQYIFSQPNKAGHFQRVELTRTGAEPLDFIVGDPAAQDELREGAWIAAYTAKMMRGVL